MNEELVIRDKRFAVIDGAGKSTDRGKPALKVVDSGRPRVTGLIHRLVSRGQYHRSPTEIAKRVIAAHLVSEDHNGSKEIP